MKSWLILLGISIAATATEATLIDSIRAGDVANVESLLKAGADANSKDDRGVPALLYAAAYLPLNSLQALIAAGADVNSTSPSGSTPLMTAIGEPAKVRFLVESGANVNARSKAGNTPLALALRLPTGAENARYLYRKGAKPNSTALRAALTTGVLDLARAFLNADIEVSPNVVDGAVISRDAELLLTVLERVPSAVNFKRDLGESTPLMNVAFGGSTSSAEILLKYGADVNAADTRRRTALMYAAGADRPNAAMITLLVSKGAKLELKDTRGQSALEIALQRGLPQNVRALGGKFIKKTAVTPESTSALVPVREALTRAMALLEDSGPKFFKANGCTSCHNQSIPQMAAAALRKESGAAEPRHTESVHAKYVLSEFRARQDSRWETQCVGNGGLAIATYGLTGLAEEGIARSPTTDQVVRCMAELQNFNGSWGNDGDSLRLPLGGSRSKHTALAVRGLQAYMIPGRREDFFKRIERARHFLEATKEQDTQSLAFRILGLKWAGASDRTIRPIALALAKLQLKNGAWAQTPEMEPDAYATSQALWALREGGRWKATDPKIALGVNYLRQTQNIDGSWHVRARAFGFQPYRETGFPHQHDQWISAAATGFAVMALAPFMEAPRATTASAKRASRVQPR
jgi:ankyrin repeat protein